MSPLIKSITLKSGSTASTSPLKFSPGSITLFVGPNHSGKSKLLQEIRESIPREGHTQRTKILGNLEFNPLPDNVRNKYESEFQRCSEPYTENGLPHFRISKDGHQWNLSQQQFETFLQGLRTVEGLRTVHGSLGHNLANRLSLILNGNQRLNLLNPTKREDLRGAMTTTLGVLFSDDSKRASFQRILFEAFGWYFTIDVTGAEQFRAAISDSKPPPGVERSIGSEALQFFASCRDIMEMSDGVRAFAGMVAAVIASEALLILIDEPEAFLHPSLSTRLAIEMAKQGHDRGTQVMVATHSAPFLLGCIQAGVDFNVVRLTYKNGQASARIIENTQIVTLMRNPLLRSIGLLNGLFFQSVIVTEAEKDRAFYEEINHRCLDSGHGGGIADCLFLNAQNWQTTWIVGPLRKIGIPAAAIIDVDVVCEIATTAFSRLLEAADIPEPTRAGLAQTRGMLRPTSDVEKRALKEKGISALPQEQKAAFEDFIESLAVYGIFIVPCGELECWLPNLSRSSNSKSEWLEQTFKAMGEDISLASYVKPAEGDVWAFMVKIRTWLNNPDRRGIPVA